MVLKEDYQTVELNSETQNTEKEAVKVNKKSTSYDLLKRVFDIVLSLLALVVLAVPLVIVSIIILIDSPGASPIYTQLRIGKDGRSFKFYKFRSMVPNAESLLDELLPDNEMDGPAFKMKDDPRITRFGRFIRRCSIDELPQFINVIKGDMSLVGPRPPLPREVEMYTDFQRQRLTVIPGITCFWQVQPSRNELSFDEWLEWDLKYIEERSIKTDLYILIKTFGAVCGLEGV